MDIHPDVLVIVFWYNSLILWGKIIDMQRCAGYYCLSTELYKQKCHVMNPQKSNNRGLTQL